MKGWAHTLVKNEERYVWYAVMSVIDWVDKILIWDTGRTDKTIEIIKEIEKVYPDKVDFKEVGEVDPQKFTKVRQKMLDATGSDWLILIDGDEVWWEDSIKAVISTVRTEGETLETIITVPYNIVGDIYHYQEEAAGRYEIDGRRGHLSIRALSRKIPGLHLEKPHGIQGFFDKNGILIQERQKKFRKFLDASFMPFTYMARSSSREKDLKVPKRDIKLKYELGIPFPLDFYFPEVFFRPRPDIVPSPWFNMDRAYLAKALVQTPFRKLKRRIWRGRVGY